jgi:ABC-type multidrug transport system fused ATPase/permease subunit
MFSTFRRLAVIYKGYRLRLLLSQILLLISATATILVVTQIQKVIDAGIAVGNTEVIVRTGIWMMVLAMISGLCLAGTAYFAVFFAQGTAFIVRRELYNKIQTFSFENFDQFRTGNLMVRLNADVNSGTRPLRAAATTSLAVSANAWASVVRSRPSRACSFSTIARAPSTSQPKAAYRSKFLTSYPILQPSMLPNASAP